jgi:hypothetical protein
MNLIYIYKNIIYHCLLIHIDRFLSPATLPIVAYEPTFAAFSRTMFGACSFTLSSQHQHHLVSHDVP